MADQDISIETNTVAQRASTPPPSTPATHGWLRAGWRRTAIVAAAFVVIAVTGVLYWRSTAWESTDDAQVDGFIYPISARVAGHVARVLVEDNQYVTAGTILVLLDPKDYEVAVANAEAEVANNEAVASAQRANVPITSTETASRLSTAEASVETAQAGLAIAVRQLEGARAALRQAQANDLKAQDDVQRYAPLAAKDEIPQQEYTRAVDAQKATAAAVDAAKASASAAELAVTQARAKIAQAESDLASARTRPNQIVAQRAHLDAAQADSARARTSLEQARLNLQYTTIVAPVSGIVGRRTAQPGQNVNAGQQLLTIVPLDAKNLWVTANFKETQLKHMQPGQPATITVDAYGRTYQGHVLNVAGASGARYSLLPPENATGNYVKVVQRIPVKIVLEPGQDTSPLRVGMSVEPRVRIR